MVAALEALLDGVIDYAGLFPPAQHAMLPAVEEYLGHLAGDEQLLVNRFVCPVSRLSEFTEALRSTETDEGFEITAIGGGGGSLDEFRRQCGADAQAIESFEAELDGQVTVEAYEVRIPDAPISQILKAVAPLTQLDLYLESPLDGGMIDRLHGIADSEIACAKARTGGADAKAFPPPEVLAEFIKECLDLNLPFKLTAGLHHPVRVDDRASGGVMHGFLNVLVGAALVEEMDLTRAELAMVLQERDPRTFEFDDEGAGWKSLRAGVAAIESMRTLFAGFGSCSIDEPVDDLQKLSLW